MSSLVLYSCSTDMVFKSHNVSFVQVFCNGCMKPSELRQHLQNYHPGNVDETRTSFETKRVRFEESGTLDVHGFVK